MEVFETQEHARNEKFGLLLSELPLLADVISEITSRHVINDEVQVVSILERVVHIDEEWVAELAQELFLVHH